jgi:pimeloyl-ACP methyl ester carboxylesterase
MHDPLTIHGSSTAKYAVLYLHDIPLLSKAIIETLGTEFAVIAPLPNVNQYWSQRVCKNDRNSISAEEYLITEVIPWIAARYAAPIAIVGHGVGGQAALRLAFRYPDRLPIVASLEGVLDLQDRYGTGSPLDELYDRREQVRQDTAVLQVRQNAAPPQIWFACDTTSEQWRGHDRLHEKLNAVGVPHVWQQRDAEQAAVQCREFLRVAIPKQARRLFG